MNGKKSKLTGLISKLTAAANKAVSAKKSDRRFSKHPQENYSHTLKYSSLEKVLRTA
jgi:hypothetical protein